MFDHQLPGRFHPGDVSLAYAYSSVGLVQLGGQATNFEMIVI
jgi:hypothetical protein